ncbi:MAG: phage major capsid protein, partial [Alphaproteobacteria bacterium]
MSDRIKELREKRAKLVHDAREKLDEITEKTKPEDAEEIHRVADAMLDESDALAREAEKLEREQRLARAQEELEKPIERQSGREDRTAAPEASDA